MIWSFLSVLLPFLFVLTVVVFIHELGHFLVARWCGVKVQAFSIGFGREIWGFYDRHGTRWRLAWIPLGGYVKFVDDENGASVPSRDALDRMSADDRQGAFQTKPLSQRAAIVAAGPIANFLLAIVIFAAVFATVGAPFTAPKVHQLLAGTPAAVAGVRPGDMIVAIDGRSMDNLQDVERVVSASPGRELSLQVDRGGVPLSFLLKPDRITRNDGYGGTVQIGDIGLRRVSPPRIIEVLPGQPAAMAGLKEGDLIVAIDGNPIVSFQAVQEIVSASDGKTLGFEIERGAEHMTLRVEPKGRERTDPSGGKAQQWVIGVRGGGSDTEYRRLGVFESIWRGGSETLFVATSTLAYIKDVIIGRQSADQLGGPLRIADVSGRVAQHGFDELLRLTAVLSVSIGLLNLFPIPLLDGGHLMFYLVEAIRRRPLSERTQEIGFRIGLSLVLMLMIFATFNDRGVVKRWIGLG